MAGRKKKSTKKVVEKVVSEIEEEIAVAEDKEPDAWPPHIGIWGGSTRRAALKNLKLNPDHELISGLVPKPGVIINGIGILGKQLLPKLMWQEIHSMISRRAANEKRFKSGGKRSTTDLGEFRG